MRSLVILLLSVRSCAGHPRASCAPLQPKAFDRANDYNKGAAPIPPLHLCEEEYEGTVFGRDGKVNEGAEGGGGSVEGGC